MTETGFWQSIFMENFLLWKSFYSAALTLKNIQVKSRRSFKYLPKSFSMALMLCLLWYSLKAA